MFAMSGDLPRALLLWCSGPEKSSHRWHELQINSSLAQSPQLLAHFPGLIMLNVVTSPRSLQFLGCFAPKLRALRSADANPEMALSPGNESHSPTE